jgi:NAD(P)-dependent dehydrogenase (short-subunit alcohol dehydrogenase family)
MEKRMDNHPALTPGRTAVVTGGAGGIGLAAARRFASLGMKVVIVDIDQATLDRAADEIAAAAPDGKGEVMAVRTDVGQRQEVEALKDRVMASFGEVAVLMNNAGVAGGAGPLEKYEAWQRVIATNLWGVINGVQCFAPAMIGQATPAAIVNTGSKQGITCPPGDTAYNVSKAGVKVFSEGLQHVLRNTDGCKVTAHLLVPGWTHTAMTARGGDKPAGAWWPDQVIDMLIEAMGKGDFYIICPDNEVTRAVDNKRILWAAGDIAENRPPLSRWHPDYKDAFAAFLKDEAG